MRHDCDCNCDNDNGGIFDHIYTGDEIIPWALDYPIRRGYQNYPPVKEEKSVGTYQRRNWNMSWHAFFSKAFRIARVVPLVGVLALIIGVIIRSIF